MAEMVECVLYEEIDLSEVKVQPEITMVQSEASSTIIQPNIQPGVTVVQSDGTSPVFQPHLQPGVTVVQPAPVAAVVQPVVRQTLMVSQPNLQDIPAQFRCAYCQLDIITVTRYMADTTVACSLFGSHCTFDVWPCCLVPFRSCTDVEHSCPNCRNVLYIFKRHS